MTSSDASPRGVPAIISYLAFGLLALVTAAIFAIVWNRIPVDVAVLALLGSIVTAATAGPAACYGYWLASSASANSAARDQRAVIAAKAGVEPPAAPLAADPQSTKETT